jgi:hypothetical protein
LKIGMQPDAPPSLTIQAAAPAHLIRALRGEPFPDEHARERWKESSEPKSPRTLRTLRLNLPRAARDEEISCAV